MNYNDQIDSILAEQNGSEFQKLVANELALIHGKVPRQQVSQWLHPDREKRTEPRWSMGHVLFHAIDNILERQVKGLENKLQSPPEVPSVPA